jgi:hypothetical protein
MAGYYIAVEPIWISRGSLLMKPLHLLHSESVRPSLIRHHNPVPAQGPN